MIFAITGVKGEDSYTVNNYSGSKKDLVLIATGTKDGQFKSKLFTVSLDASINFPHFDINIPDEVYTWENRKLFTWENGKLSPFTAVRAIYK